VTVTGISERCYSMCVRACVRVRVGGEWCESGSRESCPLYELIIVFVASKMADRQVLYLGTSNDSQKLVPPSY